jgi:hypothetical protein
MSNTSKSYTKKLKKYLSRSRLINKLSPKRFWQKNIWHKLVFILVVFGLLCLATMYGISRWYAWSERNVPYTTGVSFVPDYASYLGVNPEQTMDALINDLHVKNFRLTSYWSDIEPTKGNYDFSQLDWEFQKADAAHAKITLSIGLRQPRWPECHQPSWVNTNDPESDWVPELENYMSAVINRYKSNPALQSYQLENEFLLQGFGTCTNSTRDRDRLIAEYNLVTKLDPAHPVIISRSDNAIGWPINQPKPSEYGISIYRRVWSAPIGRYLEYPFPAWYYGFLAGVEKLWSGKDMIIHEMQAEPWAPQNSTIPEISLAEQNKSFNAKRFSQEIGFVKATGMHSVYYWGAEYWYYRKVVLHDPSVWNVAKQNFAKPSIK